MHDHTGDREIRPTSGRVGLYAIVIHSNQVRFFVYRNYAALESFFNLMSTLTDFCKPMSKLFLQNQYLQLNHEVTFLFVRIKKKQESNQLNKQTNKQTNKPTNKKEKRKRTNERTNEKTNGKTATANKRNKLH